LIFRLESLRFTFVAHEAIHFAHGKSANILRGAFGLIFRRIACLPECRSAASCDVRGSCPYARLFEPSAMHDGPSGLADWPRPFVFRAMHLDGQTFAAGQEFYFDINLFDLSPENIAYLILTFAQLSREGLGPGRCKVELTGVTRRNEPAVPIYESGSIRNEGAGGPLELDLSPGKEAVARITVRFLTPTELKSGQQIAARPEFQILAARARDRISTLRELYGEGPLEMDFRGFGERAGRVRMTGCRLETIRVERRSSRTGQTHPIGGFVGEADYEGELGEFLPILRAAEYTGVGRQTVWGKGSIGVRPQKLR
jgi:hypothetical protein